MVLILLIYHLSVSFTWLYSLVVAPRQPHSSTLISLPLCQERKQAKQVLGLFSWLIQTSFVSIVGYLATKHGRFSRYCSVDSQDALNLLIFNKYVSPRVLLSLYIRLIFGLWMRRNLRQKAKIWHRPSERSARIGSPHHNTDRNPQFLCLRF